MGDGNNFPIPKEELADEYFGVVIAAHQEMREAFYASGITQEALAERLNIDKSLISRRLNGEENLTLRTMSSMGTGMGYRVCVRFVPFDSLGSNNWCQQTVDEVGGEGTNIAPIETNAQ